MPVDLRLAWNSAISSFPSGLELHWRDDLVKIWIASQATFWPSKKALPTPPAIDIWAPNSGPRRTSFFFIPFGTIGTTGTFGTILPRPGSSRSKCSNRSSRFGSSHEVPSFYQRQGDAAGAQQFVVKIAQSELGAEPPLFLVAQTVDD